MATPPTMYDGFTELRHGQNASRNPMLLPETQCARAINVQFRGGCARTRPGWVKVPVDLPEGEFQGCGRWHLDTGDLLVFVVSGYVYTIDVETLAILNHGWRTEEGRQCEFLAANRFMTIRDGVSVPCVLEWRVGVVRRRPVAGQSMPRGLVGVFAHGRYHLVPAIVPSTGQSGRNCILSGDIQEIGRPTTLLRFSETTYLAEGGANALPAELGEVGAMGVYRNAASGTGMGNIIAFGENGVCAFDFSLPREMWKQQPLSQVLFFGYGCASPWGVLNVNDDLLYRADDGIRVLKYTISQTAGNSGSLSNTPASLEVDPFMVDDFAWRGRVSAALNDNRAIYTVGAREWEDVDVEHEAYHSHPPTFYKGLVVWDFGAGYYSGAEGLGAYDGLWTGLNIAKVESAVRDGRRLLYAFTTDPALYVMEAGAVVDACTTPIQSRIETRAFAFGDLVSAKHLQYVEVWATDIQVTTEIKVWYRPHGYQLWKALGTRTITVPDGSLAHSHRRFRFSLDYSDSNCDPTSGEPLWVATGFQFAVQWTGNMVLERVRGAAQVVGEAPPPPCDWAGQSLAESDAAGEVLNDYDYDIDCGDEIEFEVYALQTPWPEDATLDPGIEPGTYDGLEEETEPEEGSPQQQAQINQGGTGDTPEPQEPGWPEQAQHQWPAPSFPPATGDPSWDAITIATNPTTNVAPTTATLNGTLGLGDATSASVWFRYRVKDAGSWLSTSTQSQSASGVFNASVTGLTPETTYEFRALGSVGGGDVAGAILEFMTPAEPIAPLDPGAWVPTHTWQAEPPDCDT